MINYFIIIVQLQNNGQLEKFGFNNNIKYFLGL